MICPKCGNNLDLFADKCLKCGKSFKNMSLAERQKLEAKPVASKTRRKAKSKAKPVASKTGRKVKSKPKRPKIERTPIRMTYDNGIAVGEGMSVTGQKQRRGAHRPFLFKY